MTEIKKNKVQLYFDYYVAHHEPKLENWYRGLTKYINIVQAIKKTLQAEENFAELSIEDQESKLNEVFAECSANEITNTESFLERYIFLQGNGVGDVSQGVVWDTEKNPHKKIIRENASALLLYNILVEDDRVETDKKIDELLKMDKNQFAVKNRFIRTLHPHTFGSPDANGKMDRLLSVLDTKLGVTVSGSTPIEKHDELCKLIETDDPALRQMFTWELYYMLNDELDLKKAIVYYGAPGTGKTFISDINARKYIDLHRIKVGRSVLNDYSIQTVQFHPSYSYEDFFEGIRPTEDGKLKLFNGTFKQFCKDNSILERALYKSDDFIENKKFKKLEYDFSQIRINDLNDEQKKILGCNDKEFATELTIQDWIEPAFFIIDEINRAELSKVFGELMLSLEYRGVKGKIKTQYAHLCKNKNDDSAFYFEDDQNWFFVPQNIYLIGTMNNIDRSVDTFDFALRRRFMWEEVHPNYSVIKSVLMSSGRGWSYEDCKNLSDSLLRLNNLIEGDEILDKNYRIGQSYVLELRKTNRDRYDSIVKAKEFLWGSFIQPLLEEYLRGLGDEKKSNEKIQRFRNSFV
ncbi:hypothetical protein ERX46_05410 [Brumimicrobium glaciale]|uniref:ATPase dynein-related AAA domain-containing protein n=1 Tax=Brumimicrobium glaciale TaxID=200475 RepID=A0A4Q4KN06_9FLAO|nr:AAA family ATPase [Brumimicrobium glaciale]RYM34813.1 hypothetical protein ERX46_05410 [Brumimicrobium glaciale]